MITVTYITGNASKFHNADAFFKGHKLNIAQAKLKLNEIQANTGEDVALHKARDAFKLIHQPIFVNDASWNIPALNGFPGPYMKYIVSWFSASDILQLMHDKADRTIILRDIIVYTDGTNEKIFTNEVRGIILEKPDHTTYDRAFIDKLVSLSDDGRSIASHNTAHGTFTQNELPLWDEFVTWLKLR
jgi:XTP/dITP diphosphohydrolase